MIKCINGWLIHEAPDGYKTAIRNQSIAWVATGTDGSVSIVKTQDGLETHLPDPVDEVLYQLGVTP